MRMNLMITSAGKRVSLLEAFRKELKLLFPEGRIVAADAQPEWSAACQVADISVKLPLLNSPDYIAELLRSCKEHQIRLLIPTIDTELKVLAENRKAFADHGIAVLISDPELVDVFRDKRKTHAFFNAHQINTAREFDRSDFELPLYVKPVHGSRSVHNYIIRENAQLTPEIQGNMELMFLEYLDHGFHTEFTCDMYYDQNGTLRCVVPRERIEVRDGEVNKGVTRYNELVPFLRERLGQIKGARGCLTAQFFCHHETKAITGIEINPRFGGGFPLSYHAGANFPSWILKEYLLGESVPDAFDLWKSNVLMLRYDQEIITDAPES